MNKQFNNSEISAVFDEINVFEVAEKVTAPQFSMNTLTSEEKDMFATVDAWAKEIGQRGFDKDHQVSAFIQNVIQPEVYDTPDYLLEQILDKGSLGEFDFEELTTAPKNTLEVYEAAKGGTVDKSYIDFSKASVSRKMLQGETELRYSDLRRDGFKSIATMSTMMLESLRQKRFAMILNIVDNAITGGNQVFSVTGANVTSAAMDQLQAYLLDYADGSVQPSTISLSKYAQQIVRLVSGNAGLMSEEMKNQLHKTGLLGYYYGLQVNQISGAKKTSKGELLIPDKRIFGFGGKIGKFNEVGELRVYQDMDNQSEKVNLKFTGYEFEVGITDIEKVAKVTFSA